MIYSQLFDSPTVEMSHLVLTFVNRSQSIKINVTASLFTKYYVHGSLMPSIFKESHSKEAFSARVVLLDTIVFRVAMRFLLDRWSKKNSKRREKKAAAHFVFPKILSDLYLYQCGLCGQKLKNTLWDSLF